MPQEATIKAECPGNVVRLLSNAIKLTLKIIYHLYKT